MPQLVLQRWKTRHLKFLSFRLTNSLRFEEIFVCFSTTRGRTLQDVSSTCFGSNDHTVLGNTLAQEIDLLPTEWLDIICM